MLIILLADTSLLLISPIVLHQYVRRGGWGIVERVMGEYGCVNPRINYPWVGRVNG